MKQQKVTFSSLWQYGLLALPLAFAGVPLYILAPDFYATHYEVNLSTLGVALLCIRLFDALQDPFIGIMSDCYQQKRLMTMGISSLMLVCSIYALFNLCLMSAVIWFILCMACAVTAYSVLTIHLNTTGALWITETKSQTKIASVRESFGLIGLVIAVSMPTFLEKMLPKNTIYQWFSFILLILTFIGFTAFCFWYRVNFQKNHNKKSTSWINLFKKFSFNSKSLFWIYFMSMLASSMPAVLVIFFVRDLLDAGNYTGLFLLIYFLSAIFFMPFWNFMSQKQGPYKSWFFSMLLASLSFIWAFWLMKGNVWQYGFICLVSGSALGADLIFPPSIVADHIHALKQQETASTHYGVLILLSKFALAFASGLSFFMLDYADFIPGGKNPPASLIWLSIAYALIPCIIKIGAALFLWHFLIKSQKGNFYENT